MRTSAAALLALAILAWSGGATAQVTSPSAPLQQGLITASLPPPGAQPPSRPDLFRADSKTYAPRESRRPSPRRQYAPCCGPGFGQWLGTPAPPAQPTRQALGYLRLLTDVGNARVLVDGIYHGVADDFRAGAPLEPGRHRVVLEATGYQAITFDVRVEAGEVVTREAALAALRPVAPPAAPARTDAAPSTFYVIPGCYAGDRPPTIDDLPSGCDPAQLRSVEI